MNTIRWSSYAVALALLAGCATKTTTIPLERAQGVPAAKGHVQAKKTDDGNTKLALEVEHLAPPEDVAPNARVYVVWARREVKDANPQNLGALKVDENRKGKLETVTPLDKFDVMITPEPSPTMQKPTHAPVMSGEVITKD